jgi:hypothetical protein
MRALAAVAALTALGLAIRLRLAGQSIFADEISTYSIVSTHDLPGVWSVVHGDQEITPPLYFLLSWLTTRIDLSPELLRAPSLLAGTATIPLTYLLGLRTVGRAAALAGAAIASFSPFLIFYSSEARGYALATVLVLLSTLSLLQAADDGRRLWWLAYGACSCAAVYTHYTVIFALGVQLLWVLLARPRARVPALTANAAAALGFLPWLSGLRADLHSPTTDILNALDVVNLHTARVTLEHWVIGHPLAFQATGLRELPGWPGLLMLGLGLVVAVAGLALRRSRRRRARPERLDQALLVPALAAEVPVGLVLASAIGVNVLSVRHLAVAWPALSLALGWLVVAAPPPVRYGAPALVIGAFALTALEMLEPRFQRPDYLGAAAFTDRHARRGDVVLDGTNLSPAPITAMDAALQRRLPVFHLGRYRVEFEHFRVLAGPPPTAQVARRAAAAAHGARVFLIASESTIAPGHPERGPVVQAVGAALPRHRPVRIVRYPGILRLALLVYAPRASPRE